MRFSDDRPIFAQIAELFADDIVAGRIPPGARLPSARDIAASLEVNPNTAARALQALAESGVARAERGTGYYVLDDGARTARDMKRSRFLGEDVPRLFRSMEDLGVSFDEIESLWKRRAESPAAEASPRDTSAAGKDGEA